MKPMKATPTTKIVSPPINNVSKKPLPSDISLVLSSEASPFSTSLVNGHLPHGYYLCRPDRRRFRDEMTPRRVFKFPTLSASGRQRTSVILEPNAPLATR
jgi:hypothetical protein